MRRFAAAFCVLVSGIALGACGDAGDHFLEFRQNPPSPTVVDRLEIYMPVIAGKDTGASNFSLYVTGYSGGSAIANGTSLNNPIEIYTNYDGYVTFNGSGKSRVTFGKAPNVITVNYKPPARRCNPPVEIIAFDKDADPQAVEQKLVKCTAPEASRRH
ncbi:MAG TPA: hypothetical protein VMF61_11425 [Candidatus Acidoferrales bacterium]|nr:hypothetical protein [Candidatus Acidoferrales bacterium]